VLKARGADVYAFAQDLATEAVLLETSVLSMDSLCERLAQAPRPILAAGAGGPLLAQAAPHLGVVAGAAAEWPDVLDVAAIGSRPGAAGPPVPFYGRRAEAAPQIDKAVARQ
jgi:hypothetical protein